jgi:hypothetical protein
MHPATAYIDMEFGHICGTYQAQVIPVEVGVAIHTPETDALTFAGKKISYDVDVELWKHVTDDLGRTVDRSVTIANLGRKEYTKPYSGKIRLDKKGRDHAYEISRSAHADLRDFMRSLNKFNIDTLVFFADGMEKNAFRSARVNTEGFLVRDIQKEIQKTFGMKEAMALDRLSIAIGFEIRRGSVLSANFKYEIPQQFQFLVKPHKAIGDAARIFVLAQEFSQFPEKFRENVDAHLVKCAANSRTAKEDPAVPE